MITFITALYAEAKPFIEHYHAKKNSAETVYQEFNSENARILVSGCGQAAACAALARYYTKYPPEPSDLLVNIGIAALVCLPEEGGPLLDIRTADFACEVYGSLFLVAKLTETATGRTFYPDLLFQDGFPKAELFTCPGPVVTVGGFAENLAFMFREDAARRNSLLLRPDFADEGGTCRNFRQPRPDFADEGGTCGNFRQLRPVLADMEGAAVYQAALPYISPERMFFMKVVSDIAGAGGQEETAEINPSRLLLPAVEPVCAFLSGLCSALVPETLQLPPVSQEDADLVLELYKKLTFTASMKQEAERIFRYCRLGGIPIAEPLRRFLSEIPERVHGKKNSMPYLARMREMLVGGWGDSCALSGNSGLPCPDGVLPCPDGVLPCPDGSSLCPDGSSLQADGARGKEYFPYFSVIYVEEQIEYEKLLSHFPAFFEERTKAAVISIKHYKDVFNRSRQNYARQKKSPSVIFAKNEGALIYPGAPVCQSFGHEHFYYTSNILNCVYHCGYCYLQGMYPSGHMVVFVNLEDYFAGVDSLLERHPVYLCISYDTDLLAVETAFHFVERWISYAAGRPGLTLEIRTKSGNPKLVRELSAGYSRTVLGRIVFSWTLSPKIYTEKYEKGAAPLARRLLAAQAASEAGFLIRFCFDPMIFTPGWKRGYQELLSDVFSEVSPDILYDASVGVFRISSSYLKRMRKNYPCSEIVQFPYISENGVSHYGELSGRMMDFMGKELLRYLPEEKIYFWEGVSDAVCRDGQRD